jgi:dihydrofolate reductase
MSRISTHLALVAAMDRDRVIGRDGAMPWHLPEDLRRFKQLTLGAPVVMGRKTFDSIVAALGRPLPGRRSLVVTRTPRDGSNDVRFFGSLDAALASVRGEPQVFVIGGGEIYAQALPFAATLYLTEIDACFAGDTRFPAIDPELWIESERETHTSAGTPPLAFAFVTYRRR